MLIATLIGIFNLLYVLSMNFCKKVEYYFVCIKLITTFAINIKLMKGWQQHG